MTPTEKNIEALRSAVTAKGGSLSAIAREAKVKPTTLYDMLRDDWAPRSIRNLIAIEKALGLTAEELAQAHHDDRLARAGGAVAKVAS
ncbi:MAG: DNA-binding phage protein [Maricaulis maris]|jgi:DNA-binding phage protein